MLNKVKKVNKVVFFFSKPHRFHFLFIFIMFHDM